MSNCINHIKMIDAYNYNITMSGVFADLQKLSPPWAADGKDISGQLDLMYFGTYSGEKLLNKFWRNQAIAGNNGVLLQTQRAQIANMLLAMYGDNWDKLYKTLSLEYNPIQNYDMTEQETVNGNTEQNHGGTDTTTETPGVKTTEVIDHHVTHGGTDITTETPGVSETVENNGSADTSTNQSVYGFNSSDAVPTDTATGNNTANNKQVTTRTGDNTTSIKHGETIDDTDTNTREYEGNNITAIEHGETVKGTANTTRQLTRSGNIGVTTSQQMIQSERDLWIWNYFINTVFPDIDRALTLSIY